MNDKELLSIWKSYDQKMNDVLTLNKEVAYEITREKLHKTIRSLRLPKSLLLVLGAPYTFLLCFVSWIAFKAGAYIVAFGFGVIGLVMVGVIVGYIYHIYLISKINRAEKITEVQKGIAELKISSYNIARWVVVQLPFWSICWMSIEALKHSPFVYGGINLLLFLALSAVSYWLYQELHIDNTGSKVHKIFFSGSDWAPILKSTDLLEQLKGYKT
ncbi:MAG: hypothetical protein AAF990_15355 [Bacteroidota bacterium]